MTTVLIVRHGETDHNKQGVLQGRLDVPLNELGHHQAKLLGSWLKTRFSIDHIYASPLVRALSTAQHIAAGQECKLKLVEDLQEIDVGLWQGKTSEQAEASHPELYLQLRTDPLYTRRPGGESYWDLSQRTSRCIEEIVSTHTQGVICIVTHGGCVRTLLAHALSVPPITFSFVSGLQVDNTGLSILEHNAESRGWKTRTINSTAHLY